MRALIALLSVLAVAGCGSRTPPSTAPEPSALVVDSGTLVRARLATDEVIIGHLLAAYTPASATLILCDDARRARCETREAPGVRRVPAAELSAVAVRGTMGVDDALLGLYAGAFTGAIAYRDRTGASLVVGGLVGAALGSAIGSRTTDWVPLFPCGAHGQCRWRAVWPFALPGTAPRVTSPASRPVPPTRDPNTPGFVIATELPDGRVPPPDVDGNFIIGPTHRPAPEMLVHDGVPRGTVHTFTMRSDDSRIFPGIARDSGTFGTVSPSDPATLIVTTSHPAPYTRTVAVYVPAQYVPGTVAPFIVGADGPDPSLFTALDNLIAQGRVPPMIAISIGNGGGDAQGSERGLEYDTMSGRYAEFVETEVLPVVERQYDVKLTKDPKGRATMGGSSGGSAAFIMAWYHPELYHRVLAYSITAINQQWPHSDETPHGAWGFHEHIIPNSPVKPIRVWLEVGDRDLLDPNVMRDGMHDWVVASENMARVLADKGYRYQFVFARNAGHVDRSVKQQTLPEALEWLWKGYAVDGTKRAP